jgi:hemolysin activation/secretion protein
MLMQCHYAILAFSVLLMLRGGPNHAATPDFPQDRPSGRTLILPEEEPAKSAPQIELPAPALTPDEERSLQGLQLRINAFRFTGNAAIATEELEALTAPYRGREIGGEEIEAIRIALTRLYIERGFVNSGAVLPDQEVTGGVITFQLVEGRLTGIELLGQRRLREAYVRDRLNLAAGPPLNVFAIRDRLFLLQQDPRIRRLDAALLPGARPGEATLRVDIEEASSRQAHVSFDNHRSPSVGAQRAELELVDHNLLGYGDTLGLRGGMTEGSEDIDLQYSILLNARDTALQLRYAQSSSSVVEAPFDQLDVRSRSRTVGFGLTHYPRKTLGEVVSLGLGFEQRQSQSFLLGEPFAFSAGTPPDGTLRLSVARFSQSWLKHDAERVIAARSTFSAGVDVLDATVDSQGQPDGRFLAWLLQLQWVERLFSRRDELVLRADGQIANDALLSLEQFSVGGAHSVRGYRENQLVSDQGLFASAEYRLTLWSDPARGHRMQLAGFYDWGRAWNHGGPAQAISSVGVGLRAIRRPWLEFEMYYGHRLNNVEKLHGDLQDRGIHFQLRARLL